MFPSYLVQLPILLANLIVNSWFYAENYLEAINTPLITYIIVSVQNITVDLKFCQYHEKITILSMAYLPMSHLLLRSDRNFSRGHIQLS